MRVMPPNIVKTISYTFEENKAVNKIIDPRNPRMIGFLFLCFL